jgi:hypothetical protein
MVRRRQTNARRRRPAARGRQMFIENMRIKVPAASSLSITRNVVELSKDRAITIVRIKLELTGSIGSKANAGALICQIRLMGLEQTLGFKWTSGPFMVSSGNFTRRIFNIPKRYQYIMPRDVPDNFVLLNIDHICADSTLDNTIIHGLLHITFSLSQEQVVESCPTQYIYTRNGSPILASTPPNQPGSSKGLQLSIPEIPRFKESTTNLSNSFSKLSLQSIDYKPSHEAPF